jgi:hypothetical protein
MRMDERLNQLCEGGIGPSGGGGSTDRVFWGPSNSTPQGVAREPGALGRASPRCHAFISRMKHIEFLKLAREVIARDVMRWQFDVELPERPLCLICGAWVSFDALRDHLESELACADEYDDDDVRDHFLVLSKVAG